MEEGGVCKTYNFYDSFTFHEVVGIRVVKGEHHDSPYIDARISKLKDVEKVDEEGADWSEVAGQGGLGEILASESSADGAEDNGHHSKQFQASHGVNENVIESVNVYSNGGGDVLSRPECIDIHQPDWMDVDDSINVDNELPRVKEGGGNSDDCRQGRDNNLTGDLPPFGSFVSRPPSLQHLDLRNNRLYGTIPETISELYSLTDVYLSNNRLSGTIADTISKLSSLVNLDLRNNQLSGSITDTISKLVRLASLLLSSNNLTGSIALSALEDLAHLEEVDIFENQLTVNTSLSGIPQLAQLEYLRLRSCNLQGEISPFLSSLYSLKQLDLSDNNLVGNIPNWLWDLPSLQALSLPHNQQEGLIPQRLGKLNAVANQTQSDEIGMSSSNWVMGDGVGLDFQIRFVNQVTLWIKGRATPYPKIISAFKFMDLSHNQLSGNIPEEMGERKGLIALNVSNNNLSGSIPESFGGMAHLESLDLSRNMLSGNIPADLVNLTFLSVLNVSNNNLSGLIPQGKQFAMFEGSSYLGNPNLRGSPLENGSLISGWGERGGQAQSNSTGVSETDTYDEMDRWWAVSVGLCFGVGFASIIAVLCFHLEWRYKCFSLQDRFIEYICEL
ncbi:receptor-like protein 45 [Cryptomeria japonica]|uniref:receptor-like protein 45 n=1 Tax=Cryptomeria japonica TaxID=3369 RepID=UPI0027DA9949|nr:receptor-like protein 45 [Cryptomeria japonica]